MANYKSICRTALIAALSDGTSGFNAALANLGPTYGIQPFYLEFALPSKNVVYGFLTPEDVDISEIWEYPGAVIYSTESVEEHRIKPAVFSGFVDEHIDIYCVQRSIIGQNTGSNQPDFDGNYEKLPDAIEDAMSEAIKRPAGRAITAAYGVNNVEYKVTRDPIEPVGDGYIQRVAFTLGMVVTVQ
jgi:hypothetical protein